MIRPYRPSKQSINQPRIGNILDPLGNDKKWTNVWGAVMNVPQPSGGVPVSPTPTPSATPTMTVTPTITPTNTPTPSVTPTSTVTPTPSVTPTSTVTPSVTPTSTITPSVTPTNTVTPTPSSTPPASGTTEANTYLTAVVNAGGSGIDSTVSAATRTLFTSLVSNGLWDKITAMYPLLGGVSASVKFNAKNPVDTNAAYRLTFNGGWTFNSSGATGNNANTYARTYISGTTLNTRFSQHLSLYVTQATNDNSCIEMGASNSGFPGTFTELFVDNIDFGGNYRGYNINTSGNGVDSTSHSAMTGYFVSSRESDTKSYLYKNGSLNYSSTTVTNGTTTTEIYVGARNDDGNPIGYSNRPLGFVSLGNGLTPSEITTLSTIINTWATSIGRNTY